MVVRMSLLLPPPPRLIYPNLLFNPLVSGHILPRFGVVNF